ncbi:MAG: sulfatase-like hydrolase/transferase [Lunatimonas sp.]|uniref:sulfatase family protein n=1 Tax=Lunatimonas sp. TaxID=2060141 RepID=UPI00263BB60F|nr:sulfatase [Lunatimonas sp.]MCC5936880.1 sulfatase-like hydrolase/transferase [Lunatimonas sp.]
MIPKIYLVYSFVLFACVNAVFSQENTVSDKSEKPNILWITCEDISPYLGSYGFSQAYTPNLDKLAKKSIQFSHAYANAPVCAVARATILSGMYASTTGTHQMRSRVQLPDEIPAYPKLLRENGYYCTNNSKKDYNSNFETDPDVWDESSNQAHYKNRTPGQPFFAVFNNTVTHESPLSEDRINHYIETQQIPAKPRIDPSEINLPPYHPDLPEIRKDWARLHDLITLMDKMTGDLLQELEDEGRADNTIVFFYSDHGGQLSRSKRFIFNVGTQVPMMIHIPEKWKHLSPKSDFSIDESLVSFVDLAPTLLSLAGIDIPDIMQGNNFLDAKTKKPFIHFYRDRMGERYDFSRAVTDGKFYFIRNFMPHRPLGRDSRYGFEVQANWRAWEAHHEAGKTNDLQSKFFEPKEATELFDSKKDPWHVENLVADNVHRDRVTQLSEELDAWMIKTRDVGLIPEPMFHELTGEGKKFKTIYEFAQSRDDYPIVEILEIAKLSSLGASTYLSEYMAAMDHENPIVRFWGIYGLFQVRSATDSVQQKLKECIGTDQFAANRILAAQALGVSGDREKSFSTIWDEVKSTDNGYVFLFGLNAFQYSHTDDQLTLKDWENFGNQKFKEGDEGTFFGYGQRIIKDAMTLYPTRRIVD